MKSLIQTDFLGYKLRSPLVLVSGVYTQTSDFLNAQNSGAGVITTKSFTYFPRQGHPAPVVAKYKEGFLNSVGLRNAGIAEAKKQIRELKSKLNIPFLISIFDTNIKNFAQLVLHLLPLEPDFIELNLSCPNVDDEFGKPLATQTDSAFEVVKTVKKIADDKIKIIAKLTPNVNDIGMVAKSCERAGADAIAAINTVGPGMLIDIKSKKPVLGNRQGGVSGPAIKPMALRCVYDIFENVSIPIIGMGGVCNTNDAIEMLMAGASLIGVGSALYLNGWKVFQEINDGILKYLSENGYGSSNDIIGLAH
ncbi:MAG: dihydroorotate dehydrogenase [Patescibacteria group bacterium]|nr:dihydroorotate dehydrogenase [Patescibacteria group bacterium]